MYLTGDVGYRGPDGHFHFGGRRDDQVKLRGFRIELSEIEATLVEHPDVLAAAVAVRRLPPGEDSVVAWVMADPDPTAAGRMRQYLADRLPRHMVPAAIVVLDQLPTNAHGKIDRAALPLPTRPADRPQPARRRRPGGLHLRAVRGVAGRGGCRAGRQLLRSRRGLDQVHQGHRADQP